MSFEELNVPKNHIYLFKPHFYLIYLIYLIATGIVGWNLV